MIVPNLIYKKINGDSAAFLKEKVSKIRSVLLNIDLMKPFF